LKVLVLGGAGYIGSHTVLALQERGFEPVVLDDLSRGHRSAVRGAALVEADLTRVDLAAVLREWGCGAVMHFAALSQVGESVKRPDLYYRNNVVGGLSLLDAMVKSGVGYLIFSSSAAVYGEPSCIPIGEDHAAVPANPYGATKLAFEGALRWYARAFGLRYVALRYFNAAGAHPDGLIGEDHRPETHLIPLVLKAVLADSTVAVFGNDYPTYDGTCIRDYIHVCDLADAHLLALDSLLAGGDCAVYNLGTGRGYSVLQVIETARRVTGHAVRLRFAPRRPGDPAELVAGSRLAADRLGWRPRYPELEEIMTHAWLWHRAHPEGYPA